MLAMQLLASEASSAITSTACKVLAALCPHGHAHVKGALLQALGSASAAHIADVVDTIGKCASQQDEAIINSIMNLIPKLKTQKLTNLLDVIRTETILHAVGPGGDRRSPKGSMRSQGTVNIPYSAPIFGKRY